MGGRVTKCFTVNLFFKMETIPYRQIHLRYCILTHRNGFVKKEVLDVKKLIQSENLISNS